MMWCRPGRAPTRGAQVPVHDVPSTGAEVEIDRGRVDHHPSPTSAGPMRLREDERPAGVVESDTAAKPRRASVMATTVRVSK